MMGADGEEHYLARMQELVEGHYAVGNAFAPPKEVPNVGPAGGEAVTLLVGIPFGLSVPQTVVVAKFLFPFLIALSLYALMLTLGVSRIAALCTTAAVLLANNMSSGPSQLLLLLQGIATSADFTPYARPVNPEVSGLWLVLGLLLFYRIFILQKSRLWESVLLASILATSLYISIYIYSFLGMCVLVWCLWMLGRGEWRPAIHAMLVGLVGLVGAIPFLLNYYALIHAPHYSDTALRQGLIATHEPVVGLWIPVILLLSIFAWPQRFAKARAFFIVSAISVFLLSNQQVLSGVTLQVNHYHWYITKTLILLVLGIYAAYLLDQYITRRWMRWALWGAVSVLFFYNAVLIQYASWQKYLPQTITAQRYAPLLEYLHTESKNTAQAVWADRSLSSYIPLYTEADAPNNDYTMYYLVPQSYLEDRLIVEYRLRDISPKDALTKMQEERVDIAKRLFGIYWRDHAGSYENIPDTLLEQYAARYRASYKTPISQLLKSLGSTIVVHDNTKDAWNLPSREFSKTKTIESRFEVYSFRE